MTGETAFRRAWVKPAAPSRKPGRQFPNPRSIFEPKMQEPSLWAS